MFVNLKKYKQFWKSIIFRQRTDNGWLKKLHPNRPLKVELLSSVIADIVNAHILLIYIYKHSFKQK